MHRVGTQSRRSSSPCRTLAVRAPSKQIGIEAKIGNRSEKLSVERSRRQLVFSCAIDTSGSMCGAKLRTATAALSDLAVNSMAADDRYALCTFSDSVTTLHRAMARSDVDMARDMAGIEAATGGCTALWDGIQSAVLSVQTYQKKGLARGRPSYEVVIITDGQDNSSSTSFEQVCTLAAKPGIPDFNLIVVAVGSDVNERALKMLCQPKHCHFYHAADVEEFKKTLARVVEQIKMRLIITTPTSQTKMEFQGRAHEAMSKLKGWSTQSKMLSKAQDQGLLEQLAMKLTITDGSEAPTRRSSPLRARARPGDWTCPRCQAHVFASKNTCFRCHAAKPGN